MKTCKDCIHFSLCDYNTNNSAVMSKVNMFFDKGAEKCSFFSDRSEWLHLPCTLGDTVYFIKAHFSFFPIPKPERIRRITISDIKIVFTTESRAFNNENIGKTVFLTHEEAEQALRRVQDEQIKS